MLPTSHGSIALTDAPVAAAAGGEAGDRTGADGSQVLAYGE